MTDPLVHVAIRTTDDRAGDPDGIVTGTGVNPQRALDALVREAHARGGELAAADVAWQKAELVALTKGGRADVAVRAQAELENFEPQEYWFEVIDVRLTAGGVDGADSGWLAYGTLAQYSDRQLAGTARPGANWQHARAPGTP